MEIPIVKTETKSEDPTTKQPTVANEVKTVVNSNDTAPCNWEVSVEEDVFTCKNIVTGRLFTGTKQEFGNLLRGK